MDSEYPPDPEDVLDPKTISLEQLEKYYYTSRKLVEVSYRMYQQALEAHGELSTELHRRQLCLQDPKIILRSEKMENQLLLDALKRYKSVSAAAQSLDISRGYFYKRIREMEVEGIQIPKEKGD
jgi:transcriptional regulator with PAS, ATPase and Fis domain